jgi:hypothetical protein
VKGADSIPYSEQSVNQSAGVAEDRPYLYFTGVALDGIEDLFTPRTRILGLLDETQQRLAQALQLRWELTLAFWNTIATFDERRWPVEDVPWRTTDGVESDYFSLFVGSMVAQNFSSLQGGAAESALARVGDLLSELANRGRITRRPLTDDPAVRLHHPGIRMRLIGSEELGPRQNLVVASYPTLLCKRVVRLASQVADSLQRDRLTELADEIWGHVHSRRMDDGPGEGLWDNPAAVLPMPEGIVVEQEPSWYHTQRVVEVLVAASWSMDVPPRVSEVLVNVAREYLIEAEHLFDRERLYGRETGGEAIRQTFHTVAANLALARSILYERPGTASDLAQQVLRELHQLSRARTGGSTVVMRG